MKPKGDLTPTICPLHFPGFLTCSPIFRYRKPIEPLSPSSSCFSVPPISTIHKDSGWAGRACMLRGCKQSYGRKRKEHGKWLILEKIYPQKSNSRSKEQSEEWVPKGNLKISSAEDHAFLFLSKWIMELKYINTGHFPDKSSMALEPAQVLFCKNIIGIFKKTIKESKV